MKNPSQGMILAGFAELPIEGKGGKTGKAVPKERFGRPNRTRRERSQQQQMEEERSKGRGWALKNQSMGQRPGALKGWMGNNTYSDHSLRSSKGDHRG